MNQKIKTSCFWYFAFIGQFPSLWKVDDMQQKSSATTEIGTSQPHRKHLGPLARQDALRRPIIHFLKLQYKCSQCREKKLLNKYASVVHSQ